MSPRRGFTLIEALLSITTLALAATGLATLYASGHRAIAYQAEDTLLCSALRSEMELAIATPFDDLANSETPIVIMGQTYTSTVSVTAIDMDGDGTDETNAVNLVVSISDYALSLLRINNQGRVGKH